MVLKGKLDFLSLSEVNRYAVLSSLQISWVSQDFMLDCLIWEFRGYKQQKENKSMHVIISKKVSEVIFQATCLTCNEGKLSWVHVVADFRSQNTWDIILPKFPINYFSFS